MLKKFVPNQFRRVIIKSKTDCIIHADNAVCLCVISGLGWLADQSMMSKPVYLRRHSGTMMPSGV